MVLKPPDTLAETHSQIINSKLSELWSEDYDTEFQMLDYLYAFKHSTPGIMAKVLGFAHQANFSNWLSRCGRKELLRTEPGWGPWPKVIMLSRKGWRKANEIRKEIQIKDDQAIRAQEEKRKNREKIENPVTRRSVPDFGYLEPSKITKRLLAHHLLSQMAIFAFEGGEKAVIDSRITGLSGHHPDAIIQKNGVNWALEIDRTPMTLDDLAERLAKQQTLLSPHKRFEERPAIGSGGIDRWMLVINSPAQQKEYKRILKAGEAVFQDDQGITRKVDVNDNYFVTLLMQRYFEGTVFRSEMEKCLER